MFECDFALGVLGLVVADFVDCWSVHGLGVVADGCGESDGFEGCVGVVAVFGGDFVGFLCCVVHEDFALVSALEFACCFDAVASDVGEFVFVDEALDGSSTWRKFCVP